MPRVKNMLKKEYEAADGIARAIRDAVAEGELRRGGDGSAVDFKAAGEAVKALKAVEELKRSIAGGTVDNDGVGIVEISSRAQA